MDDLVKRVQSTIDQPDKPNIIAMHVDDAQALLARVAAADALAEACESAFYEVDATGPQEFYLALYAYQATKEEK